MAIVGFGSLGTVFAHAARQVGIDPVVCARSPLPGLALRMDGRRHPVPVRVLTDPDAATPADWVLLTTKAHDCASTAPWMRRLLHSGSTLVVLQNGVEHADHARDLIGPAAFLPGLVYIAAERLTGGEVRHRRGQDVVVAAGPAGAAFATLFADSGLTVHQVPDFTTAAWRKLLGNAAANPITALTLRRMEVMDTSDVRDLADQVLHEAAAVGRAAGADLTPADIEATLAFYQGFDATDGTSMLYDRLAGRPLETDPITGVIVRLGRTLGVPTPVNDILRVLTEAAAPA
ncbi:2-dehydropantoate 2-reductase [Actinokineospora guangxiensis]|uniref:2-dehydropantoate 2-reductase n=1 Tax=Actinokineospora guangxiensis TaxID=1490288 RepID=A0ABW0ETQ3_9PSEU